MNAPAIPSLPCLPAQADDFLSEPPEAVVSALARMPGDFMVLGAGGKMGLHLCGMIRMALDRAGDRRVVTAVSRFRSVHDRKQFNDWGIETLVCDLCDPAELNSLKRVENVIFMAGAKFGTEGQPDLLRLMNVEMPRRVADHFAGCRITAFSTGCVYSFASVGSSGSREDAETIPVGAYAQSCLGRELAFRLAAIEKGTPLSIVRLNYAVEFRYGVLVDLAQKILRREPIDLSTGHVNVIWQRDAVAHSLLAHELGDPTRFIINVTGPGVHRIRDLALRIGSRFSLEPHFTGTESATAWLNDASRSHELFGPPPTSLDQMIDWVAAWQLARLDTFNKPTGFEKRDGNF